MKIHKTKRILTFILSFCLTINPVVMDAFYRDGGSIRYTDNVTMIYKAKE